MLCCPSKPAMAAALAFSGHALGQSIWIKAVPEFAPATSSLKLTNSKGLKTLQRQICIQSAEREPHRARGSFPVMSARSTSNSRFDPLSPSDTIEQFYTSINEKNLKQLSKFIAEDCILDEYSFPQPFHGKQEVMQFLEQLITCMGHNLEFHIGLVCEGDDYTAGVTSHLAWKKKQVPFTKGCGFYELSREGARLVIRKAQILTESPIKPGGLVLTLLKIIATLFDAYPQAAEWFLKSPHIVLQRFLKIYSLVLEPSIKALLGCYINLWNFITRLLSYALTILIYISKIFNK